MSSGMLGRTIHRIDYSHWFYSASWAALKVTDMRHVKPHLGAEIRRTLYEYVLFLTIYIYVTIARTSYFKLNFNAKEYKLNATRYNTPSGISSIHILVSYTIETCSHLAICVQQRTSQYRWSRCLLTSLGVRNNTYYVPMRAFLYVVLSRVGNYRVLFGSKKKFRRWHLCCGNSCWCMDT